MPDLFGNIIEDDQGELFAAPQTPSSPPTFQAPTPMATPTKPQPSAEAVAARAAYERWTRRPWAKPDATDARIKRQYRDTDSTGELV